MNKRNELNRRLEQQQLKHSERNVVFFTFGGILILVAIVILFPMMISRGINSCNNLTSETVTPTDAEIVLEAIINPDNVDEYSGILSIKDSEDEKIIRDYVRKYYNTYKITINEKYLLKVTNDRELLFIYKDENGIEYERMVNGLNIDIPFEEITNDKVDYILRGYECQWSVKESTVSKWVLGEKTDSFDMPNGCTLIADDFGTLWIGKKNEVDFIKSLYYFSVEERKLIEVSTSQVIGWEKYQNSIFYLDINKKLWHYNLLTGNKEIIFTDIEKMSVDWYFVFDEETYTDSSERVIFGINSNGDIMIPSYYVATTGEEIQWPSYTEIKDTLFSFSYFKRYI